MDKPSESNKQNRRTTRKTTGSRQSKRHKRHSRNDTKKSPGCEKTEVAKTDPKVVIDSTEETVDVSTSISDQSIIRIMGKKNYGIVLNALCSLTDMVVKSQAICALLTNTKTYNDAHTQTASIGTSIGSQTEDGSLCFENVSTVDDSQQNQFGPQSKCSIKHKSQVLNNKHTSMNDRHFVNASKCSLSGKSITNRSGKPFNILDLEREEFIGDMAERMSVCDSISTNCVFDGVTEMMEMSSPLLPPLASKGNADIRTWNSCNKIDSFTNPAVVSTVADSTITTMDKMVNMSPDFTQMVIRNIIIDRDTCLDVDESGYMSIHHAVMDNDIKRVTFLQTILKIKSTLLDDATTDDLFSPLHLAVIHNSSQAMITLLLNLGCSLLARDNQDRNVFHHCAMQRDSCPLQTILTWLCQTKVEAERCTNMGFLITGLTDTDLSGNTPPMQCVLSLKSEHLMMMLQELDPKDAEAVVNFRNANNGMTALLLTTQCDIDGCGISRLSAETKKSIKLLCDKNADWSIECFKGNNPMQFAQECSNTDFIIYAATFIGDKRKPRQSVSGTNNNSAKNKFPKRVIKRRPDRSDDSEKMILPKKKPRHYYHLSSQLQGGVSDYTSPMSSMITVNPHWINTVLDGNVKIDPKRLLHNFHRPIKIEPKCQEEEVSIDESAPKLQSPTIPHVIYRDLKPFDKSKIHIEKITILKSPESPKKPGVKHKFTVPPVDLSKLPGRRISTILLKNGLKGLQQLKVVDCNNMKSIPLGGDKKVTLANFKNDSISNFRVVTKIDKNKSVRVISTNHTNKSTAPEKTAVEVMPLQLKAFKIFKPHPVTDSPIKNVSLLKSPEAKSTSSLLINNTKEKTTDSKGHPQE